MKSSQTKSLREIYPQRVDIVILIIVSMFLLIIGLSLPILTVQKLWESNTYSIVTGVENLWLEKHYVLAVVIFLFSVIFPIAKLLSLSAVWFIRLKAGHRQRVIALIEVFGKWSMLDVFVSAIIIVWVKLGALASAQAENGIYFFGASVLLTMIASSLQGDLVRRVQQG
ncbi:MAG: paraquat-inducible protein A [Candidatus Omnitrophota bacterium]|nr:paraquat-inducible protein A [Candidatus Omnitrophota bacterium]